MTDIYNKSKRSEIMSHIRSKGNRQTEIAFIRILHNNKITGWRRNQKIFGKPDFVFQNSHLAVFIDGCFWHCCPKHFQYPESNKKFWKQKLERNKQRDLIVNKTLKNSGWSVIRIRECQLNNSIACIEKIKRIISIGKPKKGINN